MIFEILKFSYLANAKSNWAFNCAYVSTPEYYTTENYQAQNSFPVRDIHFLKLFFGYFSKIFESNFSDDFSISKDRRERRPIFMSLHFPHSVLQHHKLLDSELSATSRYFCLTVTIFQKLAKNSWFWGKIEILKKLKDLVWGNKNGTSIQIVVIYLVGTVVVCCNVTSLDLFQPRNRRTSKLTFFILK